MKKSGGSTHRTSSISVNQAAGSISHRVHSSNKAQSISSQLTPDRASLIKQMQNAHPVHHGASKSHVSQNLS